MKSLFQQALHRGYDSFLNDFKFSCLHKIKAETREPGSDQAEKAPLSESKENKKLICVLGAAETEWLERTLSIIEHVEISGQKNEELSILNIRTHRKTEPFFPPPKKRAVEHNLIKKPSGNGF